MTGEVPVRTEERLIAKAIPDEDPMWADVPKGICVRREDGCMLIRQSDWVTVLSETSVLLAKRKGKTEDSIYG